MEGKHIMQSDLVSVIGNERDPSDRTRVIERNAHENPLRDVIDLLYRGKWTIIVCFMIVTLIVGVYNYQMPPEYEAYTLVYVNSSQASDVTQVLGFGGNSGWWGYANERVLSNEIVILEQSLKLAREVADSLLQVRFLPGTNRTLAITRGEDGELLSREEVVDRLERVVQFGLEANGVDFIRITAVSSSPEEAALLSSFYAQAFQNRTRDTSRQRVAASRSFLEEQEEKLSAELSALETRISDFMTREGAIALDSEAEHIIEQLADLEAKRDIAEVELTMAEATRQSLQQQLERLEPQLAARLATGVQDELARTQAQLSELRLEQELILQQNPGLARGSSDALALQGWQQRANRIRQLEERVDMLADQYANQLIASAGLLVTGDPGQASGITYLADLNKELAGNDVKISGLRQQLAVINQRIGTYMQEIQSIPAQATELAQLERARLANEQMYLFIVEKLNETRVAEESEVGYADIIREARVPRNPVRPNKLRNLILGSLFGLFLGVGIAFLRLKMDTRVYRPEELKAMGLSVLGIVSKIIEPTNQDAKTSSQPLPEFDDKLVALFSPLSPIAEMYRQIRTNIQFSRPDIMVETLMVSSAGASEGKTTTVLNLAITMAQAGRKTLVVDADLRRPRIHKALNASREPGLSDVLFEETIEFEQFHSDIENLYFIPAGRMVPNTSELIGSMRMRDFVRQAREQFDIILFDTSPILIATDAVLLATQCDATLLVANSGNTERHELEQAIEALKGVGAQLIGSVLNGFDSSMAQGYGYKYRYYQYGYGYKYRSYYDYYKPTED